jgi:hypothetical protein
VALLWSGTKGVKCGRNFRREGKSFGGVLKKVQRLWNSL